MITIKGAELIELPLFSDERGSFGRLFDDRSFKSIDNSNFKTIVNINRSVNKVKGTVRGLHMQSDPFSEGKIIMCVKGEIIDLFIDTRKDSATYKSINMVRLNANSRESLLVPRGCLHGFLTLVDDTEVIYATDNYYEPNSEVNVNPYSEELVDYWGKNSIYICSDKDKASQSLTQFFSVN